MLGLQKAFTKLEEMLTDIVARSEIADEEGTTSSTPARPRQLDNFQSAASNSIPSHLDKRPPIRGQPLLLQGQQSRNCHQASTQERSG